ncbi:unnamed protein product [Withania somnifera]
MAEEPQSISKTYPVKPKLKPTSSNSSSLTPESKYWKSFKTPKNEEQIQTPQTLVSSITSISFSPITPHDFAATHSATVSIFSGQSLQPKKAISSIFKDVVTSASYRCDGRLIAIGDLSGTVQVVDVKTRVALRKLRGHSRALHVFSGGDDGVVKYWDVSSEVNICDLLGHRDYVRCGDVSPVSDDMFVSGGYDHTVKVWDVRVLNSGYVMEFDHGKPVEDVVYLPSGGLVATAGGNSVKIWDVLGGGKLVYTMESHNKTVTSICVGKIGMESGEESQQYRILSVGLDGYMKVFDYAKFKVTHSMRFPNPLMSVGFSPDCSTRVVGASNGTLYIGRRKVKESGSMELADFGGFSSVEEPQKRVLRPSYFRYFQRGQSEKPAEWDYLVKKPKKIKVAEHDKLLKKFMHKEALLAALNGKNPQNVVAVMEELVARKKLLRCVSNLETEELGLLLKFLQRYSTMPRFSGFLMGLTNKVVEMRAEDIKSSDELLRGDIRNLKRDVDEEIRSLLTLQQLQGIISPLLKIAAKR